jgi:hypothetical protein
MPDPSLSSHPGRPPARPAALTIIPAPTGAQAPDADGYCSWTDRVAAAVSWPAMAFTVMVKVAPAGLIVGSK